MGSYAGQSPFTPNSAGFGASVHGRRSNSPYGGSPAPRLYGATGGDHQNGGDPWSSFLLPSTAPLNDATVTPASRYGAGGTGFTLRQRHAASGASSFQHTPGLDPPGGYARRGSGLIPEASRQASLAPPGHDDPAGDLDAPPPISSVLDDHASSAAAAAIASDDAASSRAAEGLAAELSPTGLLDGGAVLDSRPEWVTVFGFQPEAFAAVLAEIQPSTGEMLEHQQAGSNWAHVRFKNRLDKEEAMAKNGRVVSGFMIGILDGRQPAGMAPAGQDLSRTMWVAPSKPAMAEAFPALPKAAGARDAPASAGRLASFWASVSEYLFGW